jgi:plastocyanin
VKSSTRDRVVLPILIPVGALVVIVAVLFLFSRVLLTLSEHAATGVALVVASSVLIAGTVAFTRPHVRTSTLGAMVGSVAGIAMVSGGIAILAFRPTIPVAPFAASIVAGPGAATKGYQTTTLSVPAGHPIDITFQNQDPSVPHNVDVTSDKAGSTSLGAAPVAPGPATTHVNIGALQPGTYYFHCEVHPTTMTGTITVSAAAASSTPAAPVGATEVAHSIQFENKSLSLPANQASTITFQNEDPAIQHNIDIFSDQAYSKSVFQGALVTGPATQVYDVPSLAPGTYYFHCDVHISMTGTITVKASSGGAGTESSPSATASTGS